MLTQLSTPITIQTPKGTARAIAVIDYGQNASLQWVALIESGECWTFGNEEIRIGNKLSVCPCWPHSRLCPSYQHHA